MGLVHKLTWLCVLGMIFVIPWGNGLWVGIIKVFAIAGFGAAAVMLVLEGTHRSYNMFNFLAVLLGVWHLVAVLWSPDLAKATKAANTFVQLVIMSLLYAYLINTPYKFRRAYEAYVAGTLVAFGIIFSNFLRGINGPYYNRFTVPNIETDSMSIILTFGIPMAAWLATQYQNKWVRYGLLACIPINFYGIFLTGTRTGLVTGLVGMAYLAFTQRKASLQLKLVYAGMAVLVVSAVIALAPKASVERIFSIGSAVKSGDLNSRETIWQYSLESWSEVPMLGRGTGSLGHALNSYHVEFDSAHNSFVQLLAEHGVVGLAIYLLMLGSLIYYVMQCPTDIRYYLMTMLFIILVSQISLHTHKLKEVWFVMAVIAAQAHYYSRMYPQKVFTPAMRVPT